jgi:transcriptional regulator with XRE-family HTH domain
MTQVEENQPLKPMTLRKRAKLTQRQVATALDVRESTVSEWERGLSKPHLVPSKTKKLLELYQCTIDELIEAFEESTSASA